MTPVAGSRSQTPEVTRRSSYGPTTPEIGERGTRTRRMLLQIALELFAERGYHDVLVEDIATAADVSRATLYQYFEGKEQIFIELANEAGAAFQRLVKRLGVLGSTPEGFENLHWWLGEWAWIYDKYSTVLTLWTGLESSNSVIRSVTEEFTRLYTSRIVERLALAGVANLDIEAASVTVLGIMERYNHIQHSRKMELSENELLDNLAIVIQLFLFPETPSSVFERV